MANAIIRQEINILDALLSAAGGASGTSNEIVQLDTTQYNGATYYFEIEADSTISISFNVTLNGATDGTLATCNVPLLTTAFTLIRSNSFTPTTATQNCTVVIDNTAGATKNVKAARIVIIQNAASITNTETQIEIGNASTTTSTSLVPLTNPKYWKYTAANWDGTKTFLFEAVFKTQSTKCTATVTLQTSSSITVPSWSDVVNGTVTTTSTTPDRQRTGTAFTPVDGNWYRVAFNGVSTKETTTFYNAKVIIDSEQTYLDNNIIVSASNQLSIEGGNGSQGAAGQSFTTTSAYSVTQVNLYLKKQLTPTDNLVLEILSTSITGTVLGTADNVAASSISTAGNWTAFTFSTPVSLSNATKYYLRLTRTPDNVDTTNECTWVASGSNTYPNGGYYVRAVGVWGSEQTTDDLTFKIFASPTPITKLEPQYLLANTLFAAGTALQVFLTKWDSAEWNDTNGGQPTFYSQAEAANDSTSDIELDTAAGTTITNSTLTNIDNAQISGSALTMPANGNLDTKATTNAGDVASARILVLYVVNSVVTPDPVPYTNPNLRALLLMGIGT